MYSKTIQLYTNIYLVFFRFFFLRLLQNIKYSSLCCTVSPCCLSVLYMLSHFGRLWLLGYQPIVNTSFQATELDFSCESVYLSGFSFLVVSSLYALGCYNTNISPFQPQNAQCLIAHISYFQKVKSSKCPWGQAMLPLGSLISIRSSGLYKFTNFMSLSYCCNNKPPLSSVA